MRVILLIVIFVVSVLLVNPFYNYPVGDDWTYALSVKHLYETGSLRLADESAASLVFQVVWGYLFCVPFGFSFAALHLSTLVLSLAGLIGFYQLCDRLVAKAAPVGSSATWLPLLATLTVWFNPVYFSLSFTFYTDVPFYALVLLALCFFVRSEQETAAGERRGVRDFFLASLFSCCAVLVRQYAIVVPFVVGMLIVSKQWRVHNRRLELLVLSLPFLVLVGFYFWLVKYHGVPTQFTFSQLEMLKSYRMAHDLRHLPFIALFYVGLYTLPLTLAVLASWLARSRPSESPVGAPFGLVSLGLFGYGLYSYFVGHRLMLYLADSAITPRFGAGVSLALTLLSALSGAVIVQLIYNQTSSWVGGLLAASGRLIFGVTLAAGIGSGLLASGLLDRQLLNSLEKAMTAYYQFYTTRVPANQTLDYWKSRIGEFYAGAKLILYELTLLGAVLSLIALRLRSRRPLQRPMNRGLETAPTISQSPESLETKGDLKLALTLAVGFVVCFILISCRFDRYILILFPLAVIAVLRPLAARFNYQVAAVMLFVFAVITIASAKTMIGGYGALWTAGQELLQRGVPIEAMRINYTVDAYSLYLLGKRDVTKTGNPSYWAYAEAQKPKYIASRPESGGRLILEVPFTNYLQLKSDRVQIWMKDSDETPSRSVVK